ACIGPKHRGLGRAIGDTIDTYTAGKVGTIYAVTVDVAGRAVHACIGVGGAVGDTIYSVNATGCYQTVSVRRDGPHAVAIGAFPFHADPAGKVGTIYAVTVDVAGRAVHACIGVGGAVGDAIYSVNATGCYQTVSVRREGPHAVAIGAFPFYTITIAAIGQG